MKLAIGSLMSSFSRGGMERFFAVEMNGLCKTIVITSHVRTIDKSK